MTAFDDGLEHAVREQEIADNTRGAYRATCGYVVLSLSMTAPPGNDARYVGDCGSNGVSGLTR